MPAPPGSWTERELKRDAARAKAVFIRERLAARREESERYVQERDAFALVVRALLAATDDLAQITGESLRDRQRLNFARYLAVPPISLDDLDTLTDSVFGSWVKQRTDRGVKPTDAAFTVAATIIGERIDRDRAPWLAAGRPPTVMERNTFVGWAASGVAVGRVMTLRRGESSHRQEEATHAAVAAAGYTVVLPPGTLADPTKQMSPGTYVGASRKLHNTNMDVPVRLKASHRTGLDFLAIECKVSHSSVNSRKRLIEVRGKQQTWDSAAKTRYSFRTAAVLAGVYDVARVLEAQRAGIYIFWEHRLADLTSFLK
jgi:hypothetical protein